MTVNLRGVFLVGFQLQSTSGFPKALKGLPEVPRGFGKVSNISEIALAPKGTHREATQGPQSTLRVRRKIKCVRNYIATQGACRDFKESARETSDQPQVSEKSHTIPKLHRVPEACAINIS